MVKAREAKSWKLVSPDMTSEEEAEGDDLCVTDPVGDLQPSIDFLRSSKIVIRANETVIIQARSGVYPCRTSVGIKERLELTHPEEERCV